VSRDFGLILFSRAIRAAGFGFGSVLIALYLDERGLSPALIGLTLAIALAGSAAVGITSGWLAGRYGPRRLLAVNGLLMAAAGFDLAFAQQAWLLVIAGATGMVATGSFDVGGYAGIEQAALADVLPAEQRTKGFGRYYLVGTVAAAGGGALATAGDRLSRQMLFFVAYALVGLATAVAGMLLSPVIDARPKTIIARAATPALSHARLLIGLFAIDALAGGIFSPTIMLYWLHVRYGAGSAVLGPAFAGMSLASIASYESAGWLVRRAGFRWAMVYPGVLATLLLLLLLPSPNVWFAIAVLLFRSSVGSVDVPARASYLMAIVAPTERAGVASLANAVRGIMMAFGPSIAGVTIQVGAYGAPVVLTIFGKGVYLGLLYRALRRESPLPPETAAEATPVLTPLGPL
jgi:MFS family permease